MSATGKDEMRRAVLHSGPILDQWTQIRPSRVCADDECGPTSALSVSRRAGPILHREVTFNLLFYIGVENTPSRESRLALI